jgi:hypothetical protein
LNARQEKFAQLVASGMPAIRAYVKAGYTGNAEKCAFGITENPGIKKLIAELREKASAKAEFTRDDMVQWLVGALKTPVGEIDQNHPLAQELTTDEVFVEKKGATSTKRRIKTVGKNECARLLCDMMGWKAPEKREIDLGTKTLDAVREKAMSIASPLARSIE